MRHVVIALLLAVAGCQGSGGAVSVRWHLVDLTTGQDYDPTDVEGPDGVCQSINSPSQCQDNWMVHRVRIVLADPTTGVETLAGDSRLEFPCRQREATTPFTLPAGTYAMSLQAYDPRRVGTDASPLGATDGVTPAASVRVVRAAEVVNLDVIEIGVHPLPLGSAAQSPPPTVFDGGCPDLSL